MTSTSQVWKVVGGADKGGILVREGYGTSSPALDARLATGATVEERELKGDRIRFSKLSGEGPSEGWASVRLPGKDLLVRIEREASVEEEVEETEECLSPEEAIQRRCQKEIARGKIGWIPVGIEHVQANHMKCSKGMFYGLEFPYNEKMLLEFGASWLTKAFQAAGTLKRSNAVTRIVNVKKHEFGNNGGKCLFEVEYKHPSPDLHVKLFAKFPFDMNDKKQASDSLAQRVYKQPQDFTEVNFYRIMETFIPFKTPRFYYGDISNESTNFIMITEQVNFDDPGTSEPLAPFQIEGPYDKAMDYNLRSAPADYYYLLIRKGAIMAALHKSGKLAPESVLDEFENTSKKGPELWGMHPGSTGDPMFANKLKGAESFMFETAAKIFPPDAINPDFQKTWRNTMLLMNAYAAEINYYKHGARPDYVAFTHQNLNCDNAYFWRDDQGQLDAGIFDWGNIKAMGLGHMFYWWIYTAEWETMAEHAHGLADYFISTYHEHGGPLLQKEEYFKMFILTALEHQASVVPTVPLIYKMCPKKEFASITDRRDDRIFRTIDGKSTCRVYLHCWCNITRMFSEFEVVAVLEKWIQEFAAASNTAPKSV